MFAKRENVDFSPESEDILHNTDKAPFLRRITVYITL